MRNSGTLSCTLSLSLAMAGTYAASPKAAPNVADLPDLHRHFGAIHKVVPNKELMSRVKFEVVSVIPKGQEQSTTNVTGTLKAFVAKARVSFVSYEPDLLFVASRTGSKVYRMLLLDFPHREISGIKWLTSNCLCFDVWTGPHYGVHYVIDASMPKLIHATHFHDEFIEGMQKASQQKPQ
jgi:hypothetical protein